MLYPLPRLSLPLPLSYSQKYVCRLILHSRGYALSWLSIYVSAIVDRLHSLSTRIVEIVSTGFESRPRLALRKLVL